MGYFIYRLGLRFYAFGIGLVSVFIDKAQLFRRGRRHWNSQLQLFKKNHLDKDIYWFHCASLGEFEQAKALIEQIKQKRAEACIYLTFFSPSGYELKKDYSFADTVAYLPLDIGNNADMFVGILKPKIAFFVKYEFWFGFFRALQQHKIPLIHFSTVFRKNHFVFSPIAKDLKRILNGFEWIFVQNEESKKIANNQGLANISVVGDTRIDAIISDKNKLNGISNRLRGAHEKIIIGGSTYEKEEEILCKFLAENKSWKAVIAPHNVSKERISGLKKNLMEFGIDYELWNEVNNFSEVQVLIIDFVGILKEIYALGKVAFIGGGFQKSIHSILEPAAHFLPMAFGPKHRKFHEAQSFIEMNCAFEVRNYSEFAKFMAKVEDEIFVENCKKKLALFMNENQGAPQKIMNFLEEKKLI